MSKKEFVGWCDRVLADHIDWEFYQNDKLGYLKMPFIQTGSNLLPNGNPEEYVRIKVTVEISPYIDGKITENLVDRLGKEITDGCKLDVQKVGVCVVTINSDGFLVFSPYGEEQRVGEYFRDDIEVIDEPK